MGENEQERRGPDPQHRLLVERMRAAAEAESVRARAREWRDRSPQERLDLLLQLMAMGSHIVQSRGRPVRKAPLPAVRVDSSRGRRE